MEGLSRPKDEVKEFWLKCGVTLWYHKPLPPIDLNNLFKYAVPKLQEDGYGYFLSDSQSELPHICTLYRGYEEGNETIIITRSNEDPALALFWCIYSLFTSDMV